VPVQGCHAVPFYAIREIRHGFRVFAMKYVAETTSQTRLAKPRGHQSVLRARTYIRGSAVAAALAVVACVLLQPADILGHYGLSFYGNFSRTFGPYMVGLLIAAYCLFWAGRELRSFSETRGFSSGLQWVAVALLGVVATPSFSGVWLVQDLHVLFGFIIFVTQALLSLRYLMHVRRGLFDWSLLALQLLAILGVILSFRPLHILPLMLPAQVLAVGAFGVLLMRAVSAQIAEHRTMIVVENM